MKSLLLAYSLLLVSKSIATTTVQRCPSGFFQYESSCYRHVENGATRDDALVMCEYLGAVLVEITNDDENTFIGTLTGPDPSFWLGMKDASAVGSYLWDSGSTVTGYTPWVNPLPTPEVCAVRVFPNTWEPKDCNTLLNSVCEAPLISIPYSCKHGWVMSTEHLVCLRAIRGIRRPYSKAKAHCKRLGGDLATKITTPAEIKQVIRLKKFRAHMWVGVDRMSAGVWTYADGTGTSGNLPWKRTPNADHSCVTLKWGKWVAKRCNRRFFFVCQKDAVAKA